MPREAFKCSYDPKTKLYNKRVKDPSGKYKKLYDRDKGALKQKCEDFRDAVKGYSAAQSKITVAEYARRWYDLNTGELSAARKSDYGIAINRHICPVIGSMRICDVQPDDAKEVLSHMGEMSYSAQVKTVTTLKRIFKSAENNKMIPKSPCLELKAGGYESGEKIPLSEQQAKTLVEAVGGTQAHLFVMLGLYTGMRREEILGLCWDCVHLGDTPYVSVRRALTFDRCRPKISNKLKTKAARRDIPIPPQLAGLLETTERKSEFVVCNTLNQPHSFTSFRNMWDLVERRRAEGDGEKSAGGQGMETADKKPNRRGPHIPRTIDFEVSPHVLRYTWISKLILSGMNIKKVQVLAGHHDLRMTLGLYTKLMENKPEDLIGDIKKAFS